jgi:hypothetical protein
LHPAASNPRRSADALAIVLIPSAPVRRGSPRRPCA